MVKPKRLNVTSHVHLFLLNFEGGIAAAMVGFQGSFTVHMVFFFHSFVTFRPFNTNKGSV